MKVKVFISHQKADSTLAAVIAHRFRITHGIESYLDVIDSNLHGAGDQLAEHVRREMGKCSQLLAVVSQATRSSWWVPWEIGVASEKDYPLATYANDVTDIPEYLRKWPYLRSHSDLDAYAKASQLAKLTMESAGGSLLDSVTRSSATKSFYRNLRASLHQ